MRENVVAELVDDNIIIIIETPSECRTCRVSYH